MMPFDAYKQYLSLKNHFTKEKYDYHKYCGKSRATVKSFYKRKDRFWFEKLARNKSDREVVEFFVSNFITCTDPGKLWIGEMIREGEGRYTHGKKNSVSVLCFQRRDGILLAEEMSTLHLQARMDTHLCSKKYLSGDISIETMVICDKILGYRTDYDKKLTDPVWETVSMRMRKYSPFLNIDVFHYKKILKEIGT